MMALRSVWVEGVCNFMLVKKNKHFRLSSFLFLKKDDCFAYLRAYLPVRSMLEVCSRAS